MAGGTELLLSPDGGSVWMRKQFYKRTVEMAALDCDVLSAAELYA